MRPKETPPDRSVGEAPTREAERGGLGLRRPWTNYRLLARSILINVNYAPPRSARRCAGQCPLPVRGGQTSGYALV
jgi:hypothetical protein